MTMIEEERMVGRREKKEERGKGEREKGTVEEHTFDNKT